jgi:four helix bundle protein
MKFERFEDLPVWKAGVELALRVFAFTENRAWRGPGDLRDQLRRAALSVSNNVAEGFERGTTQELLTFLYIARGSLNEARYFVHLASRLGYLDCASAGALKMQADEVARLLTGLIQAVEKEVGSLRAAVAKVTSMIIMALAAAMKS